MDDTKLYILMCRKAKEIQALRFKKYNFGDYIKIWDYKRVHIIVVHSICDLEKLPGEVWLPRQDQLQEILISYLKQLDRNRLFNNNELLFTNIQCFRNWCIEIVKSELGKIKDLSMEQLWLAFVMKVVYNKIWNETDWVKEKEGK